MRLPTQQQHEWIASVFGVDPAGAAYQSSPSISGSNTADLAGVHRLWQAARQTVEQEIGTLRSSISRHYDGHPATDDIEASVTKRMEGVLARLDADLSNQLAALAKAAPADRDSSVAEARKAVAGYQAHLDSDPLLREIDDNPFAPVAVRKTLDSALAQICTQLG